MRVSVVLSFAALAIGVCAVPVMDAVKTTVIGREEAQPAMDIVGCYGCPDDEKREAEIEATVIDIREEAQPAMDIVGCYDCPDDEKREVEVEATTIQVREEAQPAMDIVGCYGCPE